MPRMQGFCLRVGDVGNDCWDGALEDICFQVTIYDGTTSSSYLQVQLPGAPILLSLEQFRVRMGLGHQPYLWYDRNKNTNDRSV